jgi:putative PEP-CTERM system TPR-repeat lipoprotein
LLQREYQRILDEIVVASAAEVAEQAELAALRGLAQFGLGNQAAASAEFDRALSMVPSQPDAMIGKARLALLRKDVAGARALLLESASVHPEASAVWELLGELDFASGAFEAAEQSFVKAIISGRKKWMPRYKRALTRLEMGDIDGATADIEAVAAQLPNFPGLLFARGSAKLRSGDVDEGMRLLEAYRKVEPDSLHALYLTALGEVQRGNLDAAIELLTRYLKAVPGSAQAARALGETFLVRGEPRQAEAAVRAALGRNPNSADLHDLLARSLSRQGRAAEALASARAASEAEPGSAAYRIAVAEHLQALGKRTEALEELQAALDTDPEEPRAPLLRIKILIDQGSFQEALALAEALAAARSRDPLTLNALGLARLAAQDGAGARAAFEDAIAADPTFSDAPLNLARLALAEGKPRAARELLESALARNPSHAEAILGLAELDAAEGDLEAQQRRLKAALESYPDENRFLLALAKSYVAEERPELANTLLRSARESSRRHPEVLLLLAQVQMSSGEHARAIETLDALILEAPNSATASYLSAVAHARRGSPTEMEEALTRAVELDADSPLLESALAAGFAEMESATDRLALIERLLGVSLGNPRLIAVKTDLFVALGDFEDALRLMTDLFQRFPSDAGVLRKLVSVQLSAKAYAQAETVLGEWLEKNPADAAATMLLSQVLVESGEEDRAAALIRGLLDDHPSAASNPTILNNLAWLLRDAEPDHALTLAERAHRADPDSAAVKDTLGLLLVRSGSVERGLALLAVAHDRLPDNRTVTLHFAEGLIRSGRDSEARSLLLGLTNEDFSGREAAQALLEGLGG